MGKCHRRVLVPSGVNKELLDEMTRFRNAADAVALSLMACVAAGRARGKQLGSAPEIAPSTGALCHVRLLLDSRYIRPIRTRMTTMMRMMMMPSPLPG